MDGETTAAGADASIAARVERLELPFDPRGVDPYGISKWHLAQSFRALKLLYRSYFGVRAEGLAHIPARGRRSRSGRGA